ncbi:TetR/AcrR family transcriptional regulator [Solihabitans fulvus]|uniref:TetR/AcrR family transcriptional regulator n=1 Tax=Solihabitans fulvus TaxID=1892852 RepID=A0A5B2WV89_9PSEU|nr:TetR/AcrR family transcriptional regulator [Solihabitans fulvus]KAA2254948.1 TetR/AcrR family transcriptional regulator [Solihabitans fulvus]
MTGIRKLRASETEAALKDAARRVFAARGYLNTKITDITAEAGRAAGSFYNHFAGKEELLEALLADLIAGVDATIPEDHPRNFADRAAVRWHVENFWRFFRANRSEMVALRQAAMVDERFAARARQLLAEDVRHLAGHIELARDSGVVLPGDPLVVASALSGLMWEFAYTWLVSGGAELGRELSDDEAVETLTSLVLHGIAGPADDVAGGPA